MRENGIAEEKAELYRKGITELASVTVQTVEAVQVLQIRSSDECRCHRLPRHHILDGGLAPFQYLNHVLGHPFHHLREGQQERVFVTVTERA